ncbi:unnamed protein product [Closterium sp. NIES-54]
MAAAPLGGLLCWASSLPLRSTSRLVDRAVRLGRPSASPSPELRASSMSSDGSGTTGGRPTPPVALPCPALPVTLPCWLRAALPCPSRRLACRAPPCPARRAALLAARRPALPERHTAGGHASLPCPPAALLAAASP